MKTHLLLATLLIASTATAQVNPGYFNRGLNTSSKSFVQIQHEADSIYTIARVANGGNMTSEEKNYRRWENDAMKHCTYPNSPIGGSVVGAKQYMRNSYVTNGNTTLGANTLCNTGPTESTWQNVGENPTINSLQNVGIITGLAVDSTDNAIIYAGTGSSGIFKTTNGGQNWVNITDGLGITGLGIRSIAIDPTNHNNILAGTGTTSYGYSWSTGDIVYPEGAGVIKSTDGGVTWTTTSITSTPNDRYNIEVIKYHPTNGNIAYATGYRYIYKTIDGGTTWDTVFHNTVLNNKHIEFTDLELSLANPNVIIASTASGDTTTTPLIFISTNGGTTWVNRSVVYPKIYGSSICIDVTPAHKQAIYAVVVTHGTTNVKLLIYKSINNGVNWKIVNPTAPLINNSNSISTLYYCYWKHEFEVSNTDTNTMYVGGNSIFKSTNGGVNWGAIGQYYPAFPGNTSTHADIREIVQLKSNAGQDVLYMGNDGGIAKTTNSGSAWTNLNGNGLIIGQMRDVATFNSNNNLVTGQQDNGSKRKDANGNWAFALSSDGGWTETDYADDNIVYATSWGTLYKSTNGGITFPLGILPNKLGFDFNYIIDPNNHNKVYYSPNGYDMSVYDATGNPTTTSIYSPPTRTIRSIGDTVNIGTISAIEVCPATSNAMYVAHWKPWTGLDPRHILEKTIDGGVTWTDISKADTAFRWFLNHSYITDIETDPTNPNRVWVSGGGYWYYNNSGANRVLYSANAGATWTDVSAGLIGLPVNSLVYQKGTDDVLYAGTDAGVYRYNKAINRWECFNNGLPPTIVKRIKINNCKNTITAATYGRGVWQAPLANLPDIHITTNTTLPTGTTTAYIQNLVIDPNVTFTINGTAMFSKDKRLTLGAGAQLIVNGGTLTNTCGSLWQGIEMVGAGNNVAQTTTLQPRVQLINATISNAKYGVQNGVLLAGIPKGGGWLTATNTTFLNNYNDVVFGDYTNTTTANKSAFLNCTFKANNYLNDPAYVDASTNTRLVTDKHVVLSGVNGITFTSCVFKTDLTFNPTYPVVLRSMGINSINSNFKTVTPCLNADALGNCLSYGTPNTFENLLYGAYAISTNPLIPFTITNANFTNNYASIYQSGINYSYVNQNKFLVNTTFTALSSPPWFYYANNSSGFSHQENDYKVIGTQPMVATLFNATGTAGNESYHNVYTNCNVAHQTQLTNGTTSTGYNGLQIKCNQNTTNTYDLKQTSGVLGEQGSCLGLLTPANNTFSHTSATTLSDINAYATGGFKYNYNPNPTGGVQEPIYKTTNVTKFGCNGLPTFIYNTTTCPSKLLITSGGGGGGAKAVSPIVRLQNSAISNKAIADSLTTQLSTAIANGSAQSLLNTINTGINPTTIKTALLAQSPYLGDAVLTAYINKQPTLPAGHIKDVIIANSPVSATVQMAIDNANLSQSSMQQIATAQAGTNAKTDLVNTIGYYTHAKDLAVNALLRNYITDTTTTATAQCIKWLEWNNTLTSKTDLVFAHTAQGNYKRAQSIIDSLNTATNNAPHLAYLQHHKNLKASNKTWSELNTNPVLMNKLKAIADDSLNPSMGYARAAITNAYNLCSSLSLSKCATQYKNSNYEVVEQLPIVIGRTTHRTRNATDTLVEQNQLKASPTKNTITIAPNPFGDELALHYSFEALAPNTTITVQLINMVTNAVAVQYSSTKHTDDVKLNTANIANGAYLLRITANNEVLSSNKLLRIK